MKKYNFTKATIEKQSENYNLVVLYNNDKIIYKCNMNLLQSADFFCKYKNVNYI